VVALEEGISCIEIAAALVHTTGTMVKRGNWPALHVAGSAGSSALVFASTKGEKNQKTSAMVSTGFGADTGCAAVASRENKTIERTTDSAPGSHNKDKCVKADTSMLVSCSPTINDGTTAVSFAVAVDPWVTIIDSCTTDPAPRSHPNKGSCVATDTTVLVNFSPTNNVAVVLSLAVVTDPR
jgi:hypothetical protein